MASGRIAVALKKETCGHQMGAVAHGGCEFPYMTAYYFHRLMGEKGLSSITICTDIKAA